MVDGSEYIFSFQMDTAAVQDGAGTRHEHVVVRAVHAHGFRWPARCGAPCRTSKRRALLGYGGLNSTLAIEIDTWYNADHGDMYYDHISVQTGGPNAAIGAHKEHYLSAAAIDPEAYPAGLADGKAHLCASFTPGLTRI